MNIKIKEYSGHFHVFSLYLKINSKKCREQMKIFFRDLPNSAVPKNSDKKIDDWWSGLHKPQAKGIYKQLDQINLFFKKLAIEEGKVWDSNWLIITLEDLENEEPLYGAIRKYKQPYAIARFHKDYAYNTDLMGRMVNKYCHKCFFIYRLHSAHGELVRDVLKFHGHDEEKIFCNLYQYTNHDIASPKYPEWKNIERYNGNVVFNNSCLNILLVSPDLDEEHGHEYAQLF